MGGVGFFVWIFFVVAGVWGFLRQKQRRELLCFLEV